MMPKEYDRLLEWEDNNKNKIKIPRVVAIKLKPVVQCTFIDNTSSVARPIMSPTPCSY